RRASREEGALAAPSFWLPRARLPFVEPLRRVVYRIALGSPANALARSARTRAPFAARSSIIPSSAEAPVSRASLRADRTTCARAPVSPNALHHSSINSNVQR